MFVLKPNPTFKAKVKIARPGGEAGEITFEFKHKGRKALKAFHDALVAPDNTRPEHESLLELIAGWSGVDVKFSAEALEQLLDDSPGSAVSILSTYNNSMFEAQQKN